MRARSVGKAAAWPEPSERSTRRANTTTESSVGLKAALIESLQYLEHTQAYASSQQREAAAPNKVPPTQRRQPSGAVERTR